MISKNLKVVLFLVLIFIINKKVNSQTALTIGEVFDYEIGDEFHRSNNLSGETPKGSITKIVDKWFSTDGKTVYYEIDYVNYYSTLISSPTMHLDYFYSEGNITNSYTNLDSSIFTYPFDGFSSFQYVDTLCYSIITPGNGSDCSVDVNGFHCSFNQEGEPTDIAYQYGKGIGLTYHSYFDATDFTGFSEKNINLFYTKKGNVECGNPFTLYLNVKEYYHDDLIKVYQNELDKCIIVNLDNTLDQKCKINLVDLSGKLIYSEAVEKEIRIETNHLNSGLYFINIQFADKLINKKIFIK